MQELTANVADLVVSPIDRTAANPSISFGGDAINNSGTGIYGTYGEIHFAINGVNTFSLNSSSQMQVSGTLIGYKDNATSLRVKGPQAPSEGGADVQSYSGIFYNDAYAGTGTLKTRFITGANIEMDMELQSPHQLRVVAVDDTQTDGEVYLASKTDFVFNMRADAEVASPVQLIFDRMSTVTTGAANTSDINIKASSGSIYMNSGVTTGAFVPPVLTTTERNALTPVKGMLIYNSTDDKHQAYNGAWVDLY